MCHCLKSHSNENIDVLSINHTILIIFVQTEMFIKFRDIDAVQKYLNLKHLANNKQKSMLVEHLNNRIINE